MKNGQRIWPEHQWRLFKEGCLWVLRNAPRMWTDLDWFMANPCDGGGVDEIAPCVRAIHRMDEIPWPDRSICVVAPILNGVLFIRHRSEDCRALPTEIGEANVEIVDGIVAFGAPSGPVSIEEFTWGLAKIAAVKHQPGHGSGDPFVNFDGKNWVSMDLSGLKTAEDVRAAKRRTGFQEVVNVFFALANLVSPCHYVCRTRLHGTFGTKSHRRAIAGKEMYTILSYDRLHSATEGNEDRFVEPHRRRGHVRHLWAASGIDRRVLPRSPSERVALAEQRFVRRVYVQPHWVGPRVIEDADCTTEILKGDIPWVTLKG